MTSRCTVVKHTPDSANLPFLQQLGRQINRRLLDAQRVSFDCVLSAHSLQRLVQPTAIDDGQRAPALRLGEPRVMALCNALSSFEYLPHGLTNQALRHRVADLLGLDPTRYTTAQMSYDLRRLRLKGIIWRIPQSCRCQLTSCGRKVALLFSKLDTRIFHRAFAALDKAVPLPLPLAHALAQVEQAIDDLVNNACIANVTV